MGKALELLQSEIDVLEIRLGATRKAAEDTSVDPNQRNSLLAGSAFINEQLEELYRQRAKLVDEEDRATAQLNVVREASLEKMSEDDRVFWLRRFFTTMAIGHAVAFVGLASGLMQSDERRWLASTVADAMVIFGIGLVLSGSLPFLLFLQTQRMWSRPARGGLKIAIGAIATTAALLFVAGLVQVVGGVRGLAAG